MVIVIGGERRSSSSSALSLITGATWLIARESKKMRDKKAIY